MTWRSSAGQPIANRWISSSLYGYGIRGDQIPVESFLFNDITLPADNAAEFRFEIATQPAHGTLVTNLDGTFLYDGNGTADSFTYRSYRNNILQGTFTVTLREPAPQGMFALVSETHDDNSVTIVFTYDGTDTPQFRYSLNGAQPVNFSGTTLNLTNLIADQDQTVVISASNGSGVGLNTLTVNFRTDTTPAVPEQLPVIGTIVVGQTTATVPWTYPGNDATRIRYRLDGVTVVELPSFTSPIDLTGLSDDTDHTIELAVGNAVGFGNYTAASPFRTDRIPTPPAGTFTLVSTATTPTSISITFNYSGTDFNNFLARVDGGQPQPFTGTTFEITNLNNEQQVTTVITANNDDGESPESLTVTRTTDAAPLVTPTGDITFGQVTVGETTASIPWSYDANDQNGFRGRINGGTPFPVTVSPHDLSALTPDTLINFEMQAFADLDGPWFSVSFRTNAIPVNQRPVLSLNAPSVVTLIQGGVYTPPNVTASDPEEGDISNRIQVSGDTVDVNTPGTYVVRYNVTDTNGLAAFEVTQTIIVQVQSQTPVTMPTDMFLGVNFADLLGQYLGPLLKVATLTSLPEPTPVDINNPTGNTQPNSPELNFIGNGYWEEYNNYNRPSTNFEVGDVRLILIRSTFPANMTVPKDGWTVNIEGQTFTLVADAVTDTSGALYIVQGRS